MNYQKRDCSIKFDVCFESTEGSQYCEFSFDDEKHEFSLSYAIGSLFDSLIDAVYGLCIELSDNGPMRLKIEREHDDPNQQYRITGIKSFASWDDEGTTLEWCLSRKLDNNENNMVSVDLEYYGNKNKKYHYEVQLVDLCYAVAKAATEILGQAGICGYHYSALHDSIDMVRYLAVKYIGLTGTIKRLCEDDSELFLPFSSLEEELKLIKYKM